MNSSFDHTHGRVYSAYLAALVSVKTRKKYQTQGRGLLYGFEGTQGTASAKKEKPKHSCERNCPHLDEFLKKGDLYAKVSCKAKGEAVPRAAPPKSQHITCPDHPEYEAKGFCANWLIVGGCISGGD